MPVRFSHRRTTAMATLGFASGLPAALVDRPLAAWLTDRHASAAVIGSLAAWVAVPAAFKFVWAPVLDRFVPPVLGRRRGWLLVTQATLVAALVTLAAIGASATFAMVTAAAVAVAFLSASQDIVGDAYRTDLLPAPQRGWGTAVWVTGWRVAVLAAGGGTLVLVGRGTLSWTAAYLAGAVVMAFAIIATLLAPEPVSPAVPPPTLARAVVDPLRDLLARGRGWVVLPFVVLFKLPERLVATLPIKFMIELHITKAQIGVVQQGLGMAATIAGAMTGGLIVARLGVRRTLWVAALLGAGSNFGFWVLAHTGPIPAVYVSAIGVESFCNGLVTTAFVAFLMGQCDPRFSAFQYALLSGLMRLTDVCFSGPAGAYVDHHGWSPFFLLSVAAVIPGLLLLPFVPEAVPVDEPRGVEVRVRPGARPSLD